MVKKNAISTFALAALSTIGATGLVSAADIGRELRGPQVVAAPLVAPAYDWTGFYIGGAVGVTSLHNRGTVFSEPRAVFVGVGQPPETRSVERYMYNYGGTSLNYGLYAGYMAQFGVAVFGLEADFGGPLSRATSAVTFENDIINQDPVTGAFTPGNAGYQQRIQAKWESSIRARLGYASGATLLYVTGGLAIGNFKACSIFGSDPGCNFNGQFHQIRYTTTRMGWTLGAGIEHKLAHNWSIRAEYRYTNYGHKSCLVSEPCAVIAPGDTAPRASDVRNQIDTHAFRVGLTYTFGHAPVAVSPVIARN